MNTVDFLDAVKRRHGLASDYALAKRLGWSTSRVAQYRISSRELDDEGCVQIAAELGIEPAYVLAVIAGARAKDAAIKKHWAAAAKLLKTGTLPLLLVAAGLVSQIAPSAPAGLSGGQINDLYIMRHLLAQLAAARTERRRRQRRRKLRTVTAGETPTSQVR